MKVLIVKAHPEPRSFNAALAHRSHEVLTRNGHEVAVSDLYAMGFKAAVDAGDFRGDREDPDFLRVDREQTVAQEQGALASDILAEQDKLRAAELLILQYPMWWFSMPAILKGWADRVLTRGFAYAPGRKYDTGLLRGKLALVSVTTGTSADTYAPDGIDGAIEDVLWPVHNGILRYCGFDVLRPFVSYMPRRLTPEQRRDELDRLAGRLEALDSEPRLFFHPREDYGPEERLRPGVIARSGFQHNPW